MPHKKPLRENDSGHDSTGASLGERLRAAREAKGWTLRKLEKESGVSNSLISQIETGVNDNPHLNTITRLANALGIAVKDLLGQPGEDDLVQASMKGDREARDLLMQRNLWLVARIASREEFLETGADPDDLVSIGIIGLLKALNSYDGKLPLQSFIARCVEMELLRFFRSNRTFSLKQYLEHYASSGQVGATATTFSKRLKEYMQRENLDVLQVSRQSGMSMKDIVDCINRKREPTLDEVVALSKGLRVNADYLLGSDHVPTLRFELRREIVELIRDFFINEWGMDLKYDDDEEGDS